MSSEAPTSTPPSAPPSATAPPPSAPAPAAPTPATAQGAGIAHLPDVGGLPDGAREVSPLLVIMLGTAIPVALVALACTGGSTLILIVALLAMIVVGAATMAFMTLITADPEHPHNVAGDDQE